MADWRALDSENRDIASEPWSLFWSEAKSESTEFHDFLDDPLSELARDFKEIDRDWLVRTNIINHEIGFRLSLVCRVLIIDPDSKTAFVTLYKHRVDG